jgi:hypothetical protein
MSDFSFALPFIVALQNLNDKVSFALSIFGAVINSSTAQLNP